MTQTTDDPLVAVKACLLEFMKRHNLTREQAESCMELVYDGERTITITWDIKRLER